MITSIIAHAGEAHESVVEATAHSASDPLAMWILLFLTPFILLAFTHVVLKQKVTVSALVLGVFLILYSVYSYQSPGFYTAVSLVTGFFIVFALMFAGLTKKD